MLHKVAFRSGLGNSLFCPNHMLGKHTSEIMQNFFAQNMHSDNAAVVGVGIPHDHLVAFAQSLSLKAGQVNAGSSKVHSGEVRVETGGSAAYVAVATEGASLSDLKSMLALGLLQRVLGAGNNHNYVRICFLLITLVLY